MTLVMCRSCESLDNLTSIFENDDKTIPLNLMTCADIQVWKDDGLPQQICFACIRDLKTAIDFKTRCEELDYKLRRLALNVKVELKDSTLAPVLSDIKTEINSNLSNIYSNVGDYYSDEQNNENGIYQDDSDSCQQKKAKNKKPQCKKKLKKKHEISQLLTCTGCDKTFTKYSELMVHKKTHGSKRYLCKICKVIWFKDSTRLKSHEKIHKNILESECHECEICQKKYTNKGNLRRHMKFHTNDKPFECDVCKKNFIQSTTLREHKLIHSDRRDFPCADCDKAFKSQKYLVKHRENAHQDFSKANTFPCRLCTGKFVTERKLMWHLKQHEKKSIIVADCQKEKQKRTKSSCVCKFCGKTFKQTAHLVIHERVHTGEKPFECEICGKKFTFSVSYKNHLNVHTGARPYICKICNRGFKQAAHLCQHKLEHTGEKPHKCNFCDKAFRLKGNLNVHVRIHTGERPYVCETCGHGFIDLNGLKKHVKKHDLLFS